MGQSADEVMTQIARETHPGIADADLPEAIFQIDQSDPRIAARIFGGAFYGSESTSSNTYHCRGMGRAGDGILKTTPDFQKKGGSTSSQVAELSSQLQQTTSQLHQTTSQLHQTTSQMQRMAEENARMRQYQFELAAWNQAVLDVQNQNTAMQNQWLLDFTTAMQQGLPTPPLPRPIPAPERPTPPEVHGPQQQQHEGEEPLQDPQQHDDGTYPQQDPQRHEGEEQQQPDENEMVDLGLDYDI